MVQIIVNIPDDVPFEAAMNLRETSQFVRQTVAMSYYIQKDVPVKLCASIAQMPENEFLCFLTEHHVPVRPREEEEG